MIEKNPYDPVERAPRISKEAFVHETAVVMGNVEVSRGVFIGPYAVIRTDEEDPNFTVQIGEYSNIQDHALVHAKNNNIGNSVIIAHGAKVHGSTVKDNATLYIGACADGAIIGEGAFLHAHSYVGKGITIPDNKLVPARASITSQEQVDELEDVPESLLKIREHVLKDNRKHCEQYLEKNK